MLNATIVRAKYSAGPKRSAIAKEVNARVAGVPATNDPIAAVANAADARRRPTM